MPISAIAVITAAAVAGAALSSPEALLEAGHFKRVQKLAEERLKTRPDARTYYYLSRVRLAYGDFDGAMALAEKAVALDGRSADAHYALAAASGRKAQQAGLFSRFGLARRFRKEAEAAIALDPGHLAARDGLIEFHLQAPGIVGGDKARARSLADEILRIDPCRGYLAKARIARSDKQAAEAEALLNKAVQADPASYEAHTTLAAFEAADAQKKYDLAERHAREAARLEPDRATAFGLLAALAVLRGRADTLDALLAEAEAHVPDSLSPYYQAGRVLLERGQDPARAERCFRKYLTQEPEGNTPTAAHAHWRLAQALERQGRTAEARSELQAAVRLKPDLEPAKKDLARLR
ncbi:MAG TPA: tetratricopeptide repeat protein [Vicinamibacteria bacterium]|nr:tetratricopeptide repeat protein [Vicinamibacteria bacterium]